ncbi:hypothetical protein TrVE_jg4649 [Triparma verrucosa]|uniref:SH2 domain-containing protein n=1 Tax=Triparma verrucosa TaxID=1606542 RepID=A0A9W7CA24_9STRA|nr:hypothetical protein TrVE_jg4649 [Triparma verrucosa]
MTPSSNHVQLMPFSNLLETLTSALPPEALPRPKFRFEDFSNAGFLHSTADSILSKGERVLTDLPRGIKILHIVNVALRQNPPLVLKCLVLQLGGDVTSLNKTIRRAARSIVTKVDAVSVSHLVTHSSADDVDDEIGNLLTALEVCLWLGRGGNLTLSPLTVQESIVGVRVGIFLIGWRKRYDVVESCLKNLPDWLTLDIDEGRRSSVRTSFAVNAITSKDIMRQTSEEDEEDALGKGGGWQFLVEASREEAEEMLIAAVPGQFIIRPSKESPDTFSLSFLSAPRQVQHAIIRLEAEGFRCGSYGPYPNLQNVLEQISSLLPTPLDFTLPPLHGSSELERSFTADGRGSMGMVFEQSSPNAALLRGIGMKGRSSIYVDGAKTTENSSISPSSRVSKSSRHSITINRSHFVTFAKSQSILDYIVAQKFCAQVFAIANCEVPKCLFVDEEDFYTPGSSDDEGVLGFLKWLDPLRNLLLLTRSMALQQFAVSTTEIDEYCDPKNNFVSSVTEGVSVSSNGRVMEEGFLEEDGEDSDIGDGDSIVKKIINVKAVEFSPCRLADDPTIMLVVFSKLQAALHLAADGGLSLADAAAEIESIEKRRVIEQVGEGTKMKVMQDDSFWPVATKKEIKNGFEGELERVSYRFIDPWMVECFNGGTGAFASGHLGRDWYEGSNNPVAMKGDRIEDELREGGGITCLSLYEHCGGSEATKNFVSTLEPPTPLGTTPYSRRMDLYLYRNSLFYLLQSPCRYVAMVQVEFLDLKNLTPAGASASNNLVVYGVSRLRRQGSTAPLTNKSRTFDSCLTEATKIKRVGKDNEARSQVGWGSVASYRFPLPPGTRCDGAAFDENREKIFRGPPTLLSLAVYEKRTLLGDHQLGVGELDLSTLTEAQSEDDWVPLIHEKNGGTAGTTSGFFVRLRVTLRFEIMHICQNEDGK